MMTLLCALPPTSATSLVVTDAVMGSLCSYACARMLSDVGVPSAVRNPSDEMMFDLQPELKSPVRVELEVHRQPRCEAAASPSDTAFAVPAAATPLVMGIAGRTCEYCRQWLQDCAARAGAAASGAGGAAAAAVPPFVTHMYYSADGVPPLHAVMTDSYGEWSSVPHDEPLYLLLAIESRVRAFSLPDGRLGCEFCASINAVAVRETAVGLCAHMLRLRVVDPLLSCHVCAHLLRLQGSPLMKLCWAWARCG